MCSETLLIDWSQWATLVLVLGAQSHLLLSLLMVFHFRPHCHVFHIFYSNWSLYKYFVVTDEHLPLDTHWSCWLHLKQWIPCPYQDWCTHCGTSIYKETGNRISDYINTSIISYPKWLYSSYSTCFHPMFMRIKNAAVDHFASSGYMELWIVFVWTGEIVSARWWNAAECKFCKKL